MSGAQKVKLDDVVNKVLEDAHAGKEKAIIIMELRNDRRRDSFYCATFGNVEDLRTLKATFKALVRFPQRKEGKEEEK